jgi:bifunctional ADP-heptose synthase (sugar kinase/adenylyltransferase)
VIESSHAPFRQQDKIVTVSALPAIRERYRDKRIVLCHGAFDLVHMGHLIHFEEARSNYGYNLPSKYAGADYYSVNRTEAELCLRERGLPLESIADRMFAMLRPGALSVTDGENGVIVRRGNDVFALPTLSTSVVDTIGCGDAYFALSSLAAALGCPIRIVALAGSVGAAAVAQRRGNESPTSEQEFLTIGKIVI